MTTSRYSIERYTAEHLEGVLDLQSHLWGEDREANRAYLDWKYARNPFDQGFHIYLAIAGDVVVGMRGFMGSQWRAGDGAQATMLLMAGDTVVHPAHRGRGLFGRIMELAEADLRAAGHRFVLNMSASPIVFRENESTSTRVLKARRSPPCDQRGQPSR